MRRTFAVLLVALLLFCLTACQSGGNNVELEAMKKQMQMMQQQLDEAKQAGYNPPAPAAASTPVPTLPAPTEDESGDLVLALHSTIDGETSLFTDGATELVATAVIPEGMAVDYWELNGEPYYEDMEDTFLFTAQGNTVVDAKLRPERKVTAINAEMQFLDEKNKPKGDAFTEFVFEEDYENPVTKEAMPGGWITVNVEAVIPRGYDVDYWLINGVPYYYSRTVRSFKVYDLNEATEYEVVLKKESAPSSTPKPTPKPTSKPTQAPIYYEPDPESTPNSTPEPVTYYSVSCTFCTFSGGGYSGASSGSVPAGTVITVTENVSHSSAVTWSGDYEAGDNWNPGPNSFTYTVNKDCSFMCRGIIN